MKNKMGRLGRFKNRIEPGKKVFFRVQCDSCACDSCSVPNKRICFLRDSSFFIFAFLQEAADIDSDNYVDTQFDHLRLQVVGPVLGRAMLTLAKMEGLTCPTLDDEKVLRSSKTLFQKCKTLNISIKTLFRHQKHALLKRYYSKFNKIGKKLENECRSSGKMRNWKRVV